ncbi:anoctamin-5 isoform X2 [Anoplophora glabripennis]|uniref:anoctamin-5 isoform X2 n=1 Tax=Anoplophora glabripennis TaxID=217634 RepID=UPI000874E4AA|nr:anoctamin-5 isoform X2 [Anoplophora glabripennis]
MSLEEQNEVKHKLYSSDKSPLLRTLSIPEGILYRNGEYVKSKNVFSVNHANSAEYTRPSSSPTYKSVRDKKKSSNEQNYSNKVFLYDCKNEQQDIAAMSVGSLYRSAEDLESDLDTDKDFMDGTQSKPEIVIKQNSSRSEYFLPNNIEAPYRKESSHIATKCAKPKIFFIDGIRSVDFVLVWDAFGEQSVTPEAYVKRQIFENNLLKEGLEIEYEAQAQNGLNFIKIHAPREVLRRYSEILKLRMPMREIPALRQVSTQTNFLVEGINNQWDKIKSWIFVDKKTFPDKGHRFTAIYSRDREYLFDVNSPCFFTSAIHSRIIQFILDRKKFSNNPQSDFSFGIERLLDEKAYLAGYPLHDGDLKIPGSTRNLLYTEWASICKWYRYQPLDCVKEYFGVKIALYFAWLGYYTHMLTPAALVGVACFIYSCATLYNNQPSEDICNQKIKEKMCPLCNVWCDYWDIKESCVHARITYLFDNATTVFFAVFMSVWATLFLEMWKRYSAEITHRWDLTGFDIQEEHPRPQYLARLSHVKRKQVNVVTNTMEPHVPFWRLRVPMTIFSFSVVLLLVTLALATVVAVVLYRMSILVSLKTINKSSPILVTNSSAMLITTSTAACINLVFILIFNYIYTFVAEYLTEFELLRTQTEFDDSLTLKIYLLQFVNYYASIFYIAFFKGRFVGYPKDYNTIFGYRQEECGPGGCLMELCIQLGIIMVGKQAMNTVLEMLFPLFFKWLNTLKVKTGLSKDKLSNKGYRPQWLKDYKLVEWGPRSLFPEYLEMVLQYGFVTIFVAAFPLAPFFALLNNILEMRLDAKKLLTFYRRPVSQRVKDIGVWYRILDSIGKLSVVTNGFIIAFTSEFIPKLVYLSQHHTLDNYLNYSLSYFKTDDFHNDSKPQNSYEEICRYPDYREPPDTPNEYARTSMYWQILAARLTFVVIFENIVVFVMIVVKWCIPDVPGELRDQIRRENYVTNEIIIKQETIRAQNGHLYASPKKIEKIRNINEAPASPEQWDRLISKSLSGSEFDLLVHHKEHENSGPSGVQSPSSV